MMPLDWERLSSRFAELKVVTLSSDSAAVKTEFLYALCNFISKKRLQIHYLDFDLQFSSYCRNESASSHAPKDSLFECLYLFHPKKDDLLDAALKAIVAVNFAKTEGLVIVDSINTLQNLFKNRIADPDSVDANHKAAILITLLQQAARSVNKMLLITTLTRQRPTTVPDGELSWGRTPAGGRMLFFKSFAFANLNLSPDHSEPGHQKIEVILEEKREPKRVERFLLAL